MRLKRHFLPGGLAVLTVIASVVAIEGLPAYAQAHDDPSPAKRVSQALATAGSEQKADTAGTNARIAGGVASVNPFSPAASIVAGSNRLRVTLDGAPAESRSEPSGTMRSYGDVARDTDVAIRPIDSGVQMLAVMQSPASSSTQRYRMDLSEGIHVEAANGGFVLQQSDRTVVGTIASPEAKDATGRSLPTTYTLDGATLVQSTDTTGAAYPVVAYVKITLGAGIYLNLWGSEMMAIGSAAVALTAGTIAVICTVTNKIPNPIAKVVAIIACTYVGSNIVKRLFTLAGALFKDGLIIAKACYQYDLTEPGDIWKRVNPSNCS